MPLNLNEFDLETLTEKVESLRPGQALISNDGLIIRRRNTSSGYDTGVGAGGYGSKKINTPGEAAEDMLNRSARYSHPQALGGEHEYNDFDTAIDSLKRGEATTKGPSPAVKSLRAVSSKASLHSYRIRAQRARDALARGDINKAVRNLEAIVQHAGNSGKLGDVQRAEAALAAIHDNHDLLSTIPELQHTQLELRTIGSGHYVYKNGKPVTEALTRGEAESRLSFLARNAARAEDVTAIDNEVAGKANLTRRAGTEQPDEEPTAA